MKQSLQLRVSQHLALTPQLQQSIRLLQLSTLELQQEIEQALADNPLLERLDDPLDDHLRLAPNGGIDTPDAAFEPVQPPSMTSTDTGPENDEQGSTTESVNADVEMIEGGSFDNDGSDWGADSSRQRDDDSDERDYPQLAGESVSLRDHLYGQLRTTHCSIRDRALIGLLIDELNEDGYLMAELEEIQPLLPAELDVDADDLKTALKMLQSFDPPGVGGRNLSECLVLQLTALSSSTRAPGPTVRLATAIAAEHLPLLAVRDFTKLKRKLRCDDDALRAAQTLIVSLDPKPGRRFGGGSAGYVVPDVVVRRFRSGWQATLNPDVMPKLRVNQSYARIMRQNRSSSTGLTSQLQEARWLIKNVQQRFDTILRVSQAIVDRQKAFFTHGEVAMRPLILREIAETLDLHESTISRVTTQKFMLTPSGTFELKFFFGSHVATESGGAASSTAIRALIRQLITAEDPKQPLSDSRIAEMLGEQGIVVARRTVAKYREALRIPAVAQRKGL